MFVMLLDRRVVCVLNTYEKKESTRYNMSQNYFMEVHASLEKNYI